MAEEEVNENEDGEGEEGEEGAPKKKKSKLLFIIIGLVIVLGGAGAGLFFSGMLGGGEEEKKLAEGEHGEEGEYAEDEESAEESGDEKGGKEGEKVSLFLDVPDIVVNLQSTGRRSNFVNLKLTFELKKGKDAAVVEEQMPRIIDAFNTYLRSLRKEDLQGSAGIYRLEHELMLRLKKTLKKGEVVDILFREIIVQ